MPLWKGPEEDGMTQSLINTFGPCPYRFYLYAILGLVDTTELHPNLIWGDVFHKGLEHYIKTGVINDSVVAMHEYLASHYPYAPSTFYVSTKRLLHLFRLDNYEGEWETEIPFALPVTLPSGRTVTVRGKKDGLATDPAYGRILGEHKCKGRINPAALSRELNQDLQVNIYCYLHNIEWVNYDLILIPEAQKYTPARKWNESPTDYMERLFTGPCGNYNIFPILGHKVDWIAQKRLPLPREGQERYWQQTVYPLLQRMCDFWDYVTQPGFNHEDPKCYNSLFYKMPVRQFNGSYTENFECSYYRHLIGEETLSDLKPISSLFSELEDV